MLALIKAVDLAQATDTAIRSRARLRPSRPASRANYTGYVPFTLTPAAAYKSTAMYVRAVSRHDGMRSSSEHSFIRDWLLHQRDVMPRQAETVYVGIGEMPTRRARRRARRRTAHGGGRRRVGVAGAAAEGSGEGSSRAAEEAKRKAETRELDPLLFPFEEYFFVDLPATRRRARGIERALALPPGEYDVYVGADRSRAAQDVERGGRAADDHGPGFLERSAGAEQLMLARDVRPLKAAFAAPQQAEHPYAFGSAEVIPVPSARVHARTRR